MKYNDQILIHRFLRSAIEYPDRPALRFTYGEFTYAELLKRSYAYARKIISIEEPAPVIGIMGHRIFDGFAGILGILMAGKGYLPLNPNFPTERNRSILEKAGTHTILTGGGYPEDAVNLVSASPLKFNLIEGPGEYQQGQGDVDLIEIADGSVEDVFPALPRTAPEDTAYLLFTSGSTGKPKGVAVSNSNVTAYLDNILSLLDLRQEDRFSQTFDLTFDLSVHDLFVCWSVGACLCVPEDTTLFGMRSYLNQLQPTVWFSVPSAAALMQRMRLLRENVFPYIRLSLFCGEALPVETALAWKKAAPSSQIVNLYGPTEATISVSSYVLPERTGGIKSKNGVVSIGKIFPGHQYLLNDEEDGRGMLCVTGPQVVKGYFDDKGLTEGHFFQLGTLSSSEGLHPSMRDSILQRGTPSLFYNTGDWVEWDGEGDLYFLGRADSEVKISGYRVNLLEIDHVIGSISEVEQVATLYLEDPAGLWTLVSFVVMEKQEEDIPYILRHCRRQLPHYMVPEKIIFVDALPLNPNGKTDRGALADIFRKEYGQEH